MPISCVRVPHLLRLERTDVGLYGCYEFKLTCAECGVWASDSLCRFEIASALSLEDMAFTLAGTLAQALATHGCTHTGFEPQKLLSAFLAAMESA